LSENAAESRKHTELQYNSVAMAEPLPMKLLVDSRRQSDGVTGAHQVNGNCDNDMSTQQGHVAAVSSQASASRAKHSDAAKLSNGVDDPGMNSDCSEVVSSMESGEDGTSPCGQSSNGSPSQNNDFVLIAAGHEMTKLGLKRPCKGSKTNGHKQETLCSSNSSVATSPTSHNCSNGTVATSAAVATASSNQHVKTDERSVVNQSSSDIIRGLKGRCRQPRHSSSKDAAVPATSTYQIDTDEIRTLSQPSVSGQSACDTLSPPADLRRAVSQKDTVSPSHSDPGEGGTVGRGGTIHPRHSPNGIGRGQILRMMLGGNITDNTVPHHS